ncbi:MAG TPA: HAD hydrolase family protein [Ignavibacteria bacterium]|nr:3-deoxy-D-manno-octulosonate 8-phosphate phosphatase [Bacteroidota bacterium]HRI84651.1 HAD hydrolase family protein [Ignavibacteria bacterium]HRJ99263.1 HAD hydrolase family protein [Ignavibacteria bacterium]
MKKKKKKDLTKIKFILMDLDGCLTTGHIIYTSSGETMKMFHTHDGFGIVRARELGIKFAVISGMSSKVNQMRVEKLKIHHLYEDIDDKTIPFEELKEMYGLKSENFAYIGDDEFDLPLLSKVGFSACPKSAVGKVKKYVDYVCSKNGGEGAVREFVDMILKKKKLL